MYTTNEELSELIGQWQESGEMSPRLLQVFKRIVTGLQRRFCRRVEIDDAIQNAMIDLIKQRDNFDVSKGLFNYVTTICLNAMRTQRRKNKKWAYAVGWEDGCQNGKSLPQSRDERQDE
jgi:DNA-directed RNA polymerase specialized sigma subunit